MTKICEKIKKAIEETPGLTQRGLAERMGLNPAAVNRLVYGRRAIKVEEIPVIEGYLGIRLDISDPAQNFEYRQEPPAYGRQGFSDVAAAQSLQPASAPTVLVPVYGAAVTGGFDSKLYLTPEGVVDWAQRHPAQMGSRDAFAVYVSSDAMEPRYYRGELAYIHPGRPAEQNRDCVIEMKNGVASLNRLVRQESLFVCVAQFNPPLERDIPKEDIKAIYAVVGRG